MYCFPGYLIFISLFNLFFANLIFSVAILIFKQLIYFSFLKNIFMVKNK
jgi:hypothetical protein